MCLSTAAPRPTFTSKSCGSLKSEVYCMLGWLRDLPILTINVLMCSARVGSCRFAQRRFRTVYKLRRYGPGRGWRPQYLIGLTRIISVYVTRRLICSRFTPDATGTAGSIGAAAMARGEPIDLPLN